MRVIGGEFRSRRLKGVPGMETRPTPDRLRESLFSILQPFLEDCRLFADLYAGTGAVGIEALSRGAQRALFVERDRTALAVLRENLAALGLEQRSDVRQGSAVQLVGIVEADIVFLDPPYRLEKDYATVLQALAAKRTPLVVAQHTSRFSLEESYGSLVRYRILRQGDNALSFFHPRGSIKEESGGTAAPPPCRP
jgi:16S rRNA (guanine(966)-N(2))-methyltransferase RsmD